MDEIDFHFEAILTWGRFDWVRFFILASSAMDHGLNPGSNQKYAALKDGIKIDLLTTAPSQNGLKMKVKLATYFKLNKKLCINMNSYFLLKDSCIILFFLINRFFFYG
jgi:hypothetical protein